MIKIFPKIVIPQISTGSISYNKTGVVDKKKKATQDAKTQIKITSDTLPTIDFTSISLQPASTQLFTPSEMSGSAPIQQILSDVVVSSPSIQQRIVPTSTSSFVVDFKRPYVPTSSMDSGQASFTQQISQYVSSMGLVTGSMSVLSTSMPPTIDITVPLVESSGRIVMSGSILGVGSDLYNLDSDLTDMRSYYGELLTTFDQLESSGLELEIVALLHDKRRQKIVIPFRLSTFDQFFIKIYDMFYDRKVFYNGFSIVEEADQYLNTYMYSDTLMTEPSRALFFSRDKAIECHRRNFDFLSSYGIKDLNLVVLSDSDSKRQTATKLLQMGCVEYDYNSNIMSDTIFVHKIFALNFSVPPMSIMPSSADVGSTTITSVIPMVDLRRTDA